NPKKRTQSQQEPSEQKEITLNSQDMREIIRKLSETDKKITKGQEDLKLELKEEIRLLKKDIEKKEKEWEQEKKLLTDRIENLEAKWEIQEKTGKKNNIIIKGLQTNEENIKEEVKKLINTKIGVNTGIKEAHFIEKHEKTKAIIGMSSPFAQTINRGTPKMNKATSTKKSNKEKQILKIATWNVQELNKEGKLKELLQELEKYDIDILAVEEINTKGTAITNFIKYIL
ncbi:hypothetical protein ILUMI_14139, partial [Ignelater luminosus]